ncbi:MAG TPA: MTH1187 family thiamine-binding protein [Methanobacterium sp.]|nr:MTH1187 family thiamine-binding protein [Methanobacterium sp.]
MKSGPYILNMISAELTIIPIGTSKTSISKYVAAALEALDETGIKYEINGMGTMLESEDRFKLFEAVGKAHEAVFKSGADRVATSLKIDERRDKEGSLKQKVESVKEKLD